MRTRTAIVAVTTTVVLLACAWGLWFVALMAFSSEGSLPPRWRIPEVPAGARVVADTQECASGGCWRLITLAPAAGQSPEDLAHQMGLSDGQTLPPALFDPAYVYVGAKPKDDQLVVHVGYQ